MIENGFDWSSWGKSKLEFPSGLSDFTFVAKGSRGEVYTATKDGTTPVAVKVLRDYARHSYSSDERYKRDYLLSVARELVAAESVPQDVAVERAILPVLDVYLSADKKDLYLVMPRAGATIREEAASAPSSAPLPEAEVKSIISQILLALDTIHTRCGCAHLDVNSANVLVVGGGKANNNGPLKVALSDFSFSRPLASDLTSLAIVPFAYRSPELLFLGGYGGRAALIAELVAADNAREEAKKKALSEGGSASSTELSVTTQPYKLDKADIFSAGILMCELLLGRLPVLYGISSENSAEGLKAATTCSPDAFFTSPVAPSNNNNNGGAAAGAVDADVASRGQFKALFSDLIPTFDHTYWLAKCNRYTTLRSELAASIEEEVPVDGFCLDDDEITGIRIKPKVTDELEESGALSPLGVRFLKALLTEKPEERPSAAELLKHPWLADLALPAPATAPSPAAAGSTADPLAGLSHEALVAWVEAHVKKSATESISVPKR